MDSEVDVCLFFYGLIPGVARLRAVAPGSAGERFDGLDCNNTGRRLRFSPRFGFQEAMLQREELNAF
jgi:hypothetical protein